MHHQKVVFESIPPKAFSCFEAVEFTSEGHQSLTSPVIKPLACEEPLLEPLSLPALCSDAVAICETESSEGNEQDDDEIPEEFAETKGKEKVESVLLKWTFEG